VRHRAQCAQKRTRYPSIPFRTAHHRQDEGGRATTEQRVLYLPHSHVRHISREANRLIRVSRDPRSIVRNDPHRRSSCRNPGPRGNAGRPKSRPDPDDLRYRTECAFGKPRCGGHQVLSTRSSMEMIRHRCAHPRATAAKSCHATRPHPPRSARDAGSYGGSGRLRVGWSARAPSPTRCDCGPHKVDRHVNLARCDVGEMNVGSVGLSAGGRTREAHGQTPVTSVLPG
jgi:hypothetical protein